MRNFIFATAAVLFTSTAAFAAPYSAQINGEQEATVGGFQTLSQCLAYVSGTGGTCVDNGSQWSNAQARFIVATPAPIVVDSWDVNRP